MIPYGVKSQIPTPQQYVCSSSIGELKIDGILTEEEWGHAEWTNDFVDIEGDKKPKPTYRTRAKMLWDDQYFYVAAEIEEPHLWATYDQRDAVIYHENDFEVFIDPDGDTHQYYELEINALGTVWDLLLIKPYRDGAPAIDAWDIAGLKKGIKLNGTLNNPSDSDAGWTVELAMPWSILNEAAPNGKNPEAGDTWRINFSRVNWQTEGTGTGYKKKINPETNQPYPEFNWVWSPQGVIAMHQPETWGYVTFANSSTKDAAELLGIQEQYVLREVYHLQRAYFKDNQAYTSHPDLSEVKKDWKGDIMIYCTPSMFEAIIASNGMTWHINHEGRVWKTSSQTNNQ
ncbi:MAG: carbohydrate-binding family 9-like protein [Reichenbachiella sp.]|uniref:carbohydrate-binding family 9-like protein n=2 Tax=Reichenbachiella sp. TaxID=2184521 RepID=UPI003298EAD5